MLSLPSETEQRASLHWCTVKLQKMSPPQLGRIWGVSPEKVIHWIRSGELRAIDASKTRGGRPRYLIDLEDIRDFESRRSVSPPPKPRPREKKSTGSVIEFYK